MTDENNILTLRSQLLANGYTPLPNKDKACYMEGWPKVVPDEAMLKKWGRMRGVKGTGIRVENGLCVIDIDIDHPIIDDVIDAMLDVLPEEVQPERLERSGKGYKVAWYVQTDDLFSRLHTRRWLAPEHTSADDGTHCIEIFGGGSPRQFGSFGPHTLEGGKAKIVYQWAEESPVDVPLNALSILSKDQLFKMLDAAEAELKLQGFTAVKRTTRGEGTPGRIYDLTSDMIFNLDNGASLTLAELHEKVSHGWTGRCSASWLEGEEAKNTKRCLVSRSGTGHVAIWESAAGDTHMPASIKPVDHTERVDRVAEKLRERSDKRRMKLNENDDHISGAAKLLVGYAYMPTASRTPIVPLWSASMDSAISLSNFRTLMSPYCTEEVGPRGGLKRVNPVDVWLANVNRIVVKGMRMRPDMERPVFEAHGEKWINTYCPQDLGSTDGGTVDAGVEFMEQLVPDQHERTWFRQWLAYKLMNPHVPGPSIIMVAREMGTGRGTFGLLLKLLFGDQYVVNVPFNLFAGLNYQSQYTDWGLDALFAIVNESSATGDNSGYRTKNNVYEHLKEVVEPRPTERTYVRKGEGTVRAIASTTNVVFTNNPDAIPLEEGDRRFAVLTNGQKRDKTFWQYINEWMSIQANIAAFGAWLQATNLEGYDPFEEPIMTCAKKRMSELNTSDFDTVVSDAIASLDGPFLKEQVLSRMVDIIRKTNLEMPVKWRALTSKAIGRRIYPVVNNNNRQSRVQINKKRYYVICKSSDDARRVKGLDQKELKRLILRNGDIFGDRKIGARLQKITEDGPKSR